MSADEEAEPLDDDATPVAEPASVRRQRQERAARPTDEREASDEPRPSETTTDTLTRMTRLRPFLRLFVAYASARYSRRQSDASKVDALATECPRFYWWCRFLDVVFLVCVCACLLALAGVNIYNLAT